NVRLASRLTGWRLDVRSESDAEDEARKARASLTAIPGISDVTAELLYQGGFKSAHELAASTEDAVGEIDGIGPERATGILTASRERVAQLDAEAAAAAAAAAAAEAASAAETPPAAVEEAE